MIRNGNGWLAALGEHELLLRPHEDHDWRDFSDSEEEYSSRILANGHSRLYLDDAFVQAHDSALPALEAKADRLNEVRGHPGRGQDSEVDDAFDAYNRGYANAAVSIARFALSRLEDSGEVQVSILGGPAHWPIWYQYAGCLDCPCSGGVLLNAALRYEGRVWDGFLGFPRS